MRHGTAARLRALEAASPSRMVIAKLPNGGDLPALLACAGVDLRPSDMLVRIARPDGVGADFARVIEGIG